MADTMGRSLGNILVAVFGIFGVRWLPTTLYGFYAVVIFIFIILTWINYDECQKLVYVQILTTENEKILKEKKKQRAIKVIADIKLDQPEFSLNRHAQEVIKNRDEHVMEMLEDGQRDPAGADGKNSGVIQTPKGRRVSVDVLKNSELLSPAMKKKLGSISVHHEKKKEKIDWGKHVDQIQEVEADEDDGDDTSKNQAKPFENNPVDSPTKYGKLMIETPNPHGIVVEKNS